MKDKKQPVSILIVDDEPNLVTTLAMNLEKLGAHYTVDTANNGQEAVDKVQRRQYDLVITDYKMPGMSGIELAQMIRKHSSETQVILMTAYGSDALYGVAGSLELDGYINKPISTKKIREIVKAAVEQTHQEQDPFRAGAQALQEPAAGHLTALQANTNARCVLLLTSSGYAVGTVGQTSELDISGISALVAANFMAAAELARLLGNDSIFKSSFHEGPNYDIYAYDINGRFLLAIIFGSESKAGMVRFYVHETAKLLHKELEHIEHSAKVPDDFSAGVDRQLDEMWSSDNEREGDDQQQPALSYKEALASRLIKEA